MNNKLTKSEAHVRATLFLQQQGKKHGAQHALMPGETEEFEYGWVCYYNSQAYVDTGDAGQLLGGNAPLIVDRETGEVTETGTARPMEWHIRKYIAERG